MEVDAVPGSARVATEVEVHPVAASSVHNVEVTGYGLEQASWFKHVPGEARSVTSQLWSAGCPEKEVSGVFDMAGKAYNPKKAAKSHRDLLVRLHRALG